MENAPGIYASAIGSVDGDNYLHVLLQSKYLGKWVILTFHGRNSWDDGDIKVYKGRVILLVLG